MKIIKTKQLGTYLLLIGIFLLTAGLTSRVIIETWGWISLGLIIIGTLLIMASLLWQGSQRGWWQRRSTQTGANALVATMAVLVILGLVNFLGTRYNWRQDLTESQLFTLAPQSQELVRNLKEPVKVLLFDVRENSQDRELLQNYRRESPNFQFEYIDPQSQPGLANKFGVQDYGEVHLELGDKRQLVQSIGDNERLSEIRLTSGLQKISSNVKVPVYFLQGHGEHVITPNTPNQEGMSQAVEKLLNKNYISLPLNLGEQKQVPKDAALIVIPRPLRKLFDNEVTALRNYLNSGGNALVMIDPNTETNLEGLLKDWGISLDERLAVDMSRSIVGFSPAIPIVTEYGQHPITQVFGNGISFYQLARHLKIDSVAGIEATPILKTKSYPKSWAESDLESEQLEFNAAADVPGPLNLGVALTKTITPSAPDAQKPPVVSRLVVIGDSDFATNGLFNQQLNGDVFLNSVTWLSQKNEAILSITPKEAKNRRINISNRQANFLTLSSLVFLPLAGLITAGIIWWQRSR